MWLRVTLRERDFAVRRLVEVSAPAAVHRPLTLQDSGDAARHRHVERGKRVELKRRGKRVAMLVSCDEYDRLRATRPSLDHALQVWRNRLPADFEGFSDSLAAIAYVPRPEGRGRDPRG
jgi:prevent-host-death family protein